MVTYKCDNCCYQTNNLSHYHKHLRTKKHLMNQKSNYRNNSYNDYSDSGTYFNCTFCQKQFHNLNSLNHHIPVCQINNIDINNQNDNHILHFFQNRQDNNILLEPVKNIDTIKEEFDKKWLPNALKTHFSPPTKSIRTEKNAVYLKEPIKGKNHLCHFCQGVFSKRFNLNRHLKICKFKNSQNEDKKEIEELKKIIEQKEIEKNQIILEKENEKLKAVIEEKDKTIEIAKQVNTNITNIQNNTTNKTINFLNQNFGEMIAMEKFLYNLEHHEKLTYRERNNLLIAYKESGVEVFARNFSYIMKQNCKRQMEKEGKEDMKILPLFCSDGSLRSHKEKSKTGWKTHYDNQSINHMLNISNDQVYESYQEMIPICGRDRNRVYNTVKRDNHLQEMKFLTNSADNK